MNFSYVSRERGFAAAGVHQQLRDVGGEVIAGRAVDGPVRAQRSSLPERIFSAEQVEPLAVLGQFHVRVRRAKFCWSCGEVSARIEEAVRVVDAHPRHRALLQQPPEELVRRLEDLLGSSTRIAANWLMSKKRR